MSAHTISELPRPTPFQRWSVLVFVSLAMFGNYYLYDALGPVIDLMRNQLGFSYQQIGMLSSAYNWAAILVLLAGGVIIDRFGTKVAITVFAVVCLIGGALTALTPHFEVILAGRFVLGLGAEPLIVAATTVLAKWFKGKELSLAFGMNLSISRLGSASADWSTGFAAPLYANWQDPLWLATGVAGVSVAAAMLYWMLEKRAEGGSISVPAATASASTSSGCSRSAAATGSSSRFAWCSIRRCFRSAPSRSTTSSRPTVLSVRRPDCSAACCRWRRSLPRRCSASGWIGWGGDRCSWLPAVW
jgi:MFS family permease